MSLLEFIIHKHFLEKVNGEILCKDLFLIYFF